MPGFLQRQAGTLYLAYRALIAHPLKKRFQGGAAFLARRLRELDQTVQAAGGPRR